jgi:hypothetical protein
VFTARRCVEVARPPSEASWVMNWETEVGRDGWESVRGRTTEGVSIGSCCFVKLYTC